MIPLTVFWVIWNKINKRGFDGVVSDWLKIRDKWFHYFGSVYLGQHKEDFGYIIDKLTEK